MVVLQKSLAEEVTVTAGRSASRLLDTPARALVLERELLEATPALTIDDALRQVPGFTLFRRSGSRVANPTAQGSSLRGVGPSGASRTLVLLDGVPLNDPFGGWVYWSRIPRAALDRVEVVEGGASELYGSAALGGVVQALGRSDDRALSVEASGGNEGTGALSAFASRRFGDWGLRFAGEAFTTDGYVLVSDEDKGPVDTPAGASHLNGVATVVRHFGPPASAFVRVSVFGESRRERHAAADERHRPAGAAGGGRCAARGGALAVRGWYGTQTYGQSFTAVSAGRGARALTRLQDVPTTWAGGSPVWTRAFASGHGLVGGIEGRYVDGRSDETAFAQGRATSQVSAGGEQTTWAVFGEGRLALGTRALLTLGARYDGWSENDGFSRTRPLTGAAPTETLYPDRKASALSPKASLLVHAGARVQLFAAGYGAFRGPTLNELYRSFRVGDTLTLANPELTDERLGGGELGATWTSKDEGARVRVVGFLARLEDPVANVTLRSTPSSSPASGRTWAARARRVSRPTPPCAWARGSRPARAMPSPPPPSAASKPTRASRATTCPRCRATRARCSCATRTVACWTSRCRPAPARASGTTTRTGSPGQLLHPGRAGLAADLAGRAVRGGREPDRRPLRGRPHPCAHPRPPASAARRRPLRSLNAGQALRRTGACPRLRLAARCTISSSNT